MLFAREVMDVTELALESRLTPYESLESNRWKASVWGNEFRLEIGSDERISGTSTCRVDEDEDMLIERMKA